MSSKLGVGCCTCYVKVCVRPDPRAYFLPFCAKWNHYKDMRSFRYEYFFSCYRI